LVVTLATEPIVVHGPDAELPGSRRLGPGLVREMDDSGHALVHWIERDFDSWMDPADLAILSATGRLISIFRCHADGHRLFEGHKLVMSRGLQHNWMVELLPENVIRAERSDGAAWTFNWWPMLRRVDLIRTIDLIPLEDADAEALTVAELAVGLRA
jgi:hypothetical protein